MPPGFSYYLEHISLGITRICIPFGNSHMPGSYLKEYLEEFLSALASSLLLLLTEVSHLSWKSDSLLNRKETGLGGLLREMLSCCNILSPPFPML